MLRDLEERVRAFVAREGAEEEEFDALESSDSEEEEIVFVGRRAGARGAARARADEADRMVFEALESDKAGGFGCVSLSSIRSA